MNRIQMYSSSKDLREGLHRVLAVSHAFSAPLIQGETQHWTQILPAPFQHKAKEHKLSLEELASVFTNTKIQQCVEATRAQLQLPERNWAEIKKAFQASIISGKAHKLHGGRDVYGISNKTLWDLLCSDFGQAIATQFGILLGESPVSIQQSTPSTQAHDYLHTLCAFDTSPKGLGNRDCVEWLISILTEQGFSCVRLGADLGRPLIHAHRPSTGKKGHVVLYGHYDTTPFGNTERWMHDAKSLSVSQGRFHGRGVADNKGPIAARLALLSQREETPALTWLIQGEEETGSRVAHELLPSIMSSLSPTLWLEETGYCDHEDGTVRLLAQSVGNKQIEEDSFLSLIRGLGALASRWGVGFRFEHRGLNKNVVAGGCPFNANLPHNARYLAVGINDSQANIHMNNESVPMWTFPLHDDQLQTIFEWVHVHGEDHE